MNNSRSKAVYVLLSVGIIANSVFLPAYAVKEKDFIPKVTATDSNENPSFAIGKLSEKSSESPERIVTENYDKKLNGKSNLKQKSFKQKRKFKNSMGRTVISTVQTFNEFRVYGTDQNYHLNDDGVIECIAGSKVDDIENKVIQKSFSAKYSEEDVLNAVEKHLGFVPDYKVAPKPEIILYPMSDKYTYAYEVEVEAISPSYISCTYYIDAGNLSVITVNNHVRGIDGDTSVPGSGIGQSGNTKDLKMVYNTYSNMYYLRNTADNFQTCTAINGWELEPIFGEAFSEIDNNFNSNVTYQQAAVDAHSNVTKVIKFFKNAPFYRNSQEDYGNDTELKVAIITNNSRWPITEPMAWGNTNYIGFHYTPGENGKILSCCLDVVAHEYTHGILRFEGLTGSQGETYALAEGVGDVFGVLSEYYVTNEGLFDDGLIAEDIYNNGGYMRNAFNPTVTNYTGYLANPTQLNGAGLISKAAGLMANGGTNVTAIGYGKVARIFYNAINDGYLTQETSLKQFANYLLLSSSLLYGASSQAYQSTKAALSSVGLIDEAPQNFNLSVSNNNVYLTWNSTSGSRVGIYRKDSGTKSKPALITSLTNTNQYTYYYLPGSYEFYIAYIDGSGNMISRFSDAKTSEIYTMSAPTNFRMLSKNGTNTQFAWSGTAGSKFAIYRKINGTSDQFEKVGETTSMQMNVNTLIGKCDFKVAVINTSGSRISQFSNTVSIEEYSSAPTYFTATSETSSTVTFTWNQVSTANRYAIYRAKNGTSETPVKVDETKNTTLVVNKATGLYNYQVAVVDLEGNRLSSLSNIVVK